MKESKRCNSLRVCCIQLQAFDLEEAESALSHALSMVDEASKLKPDLMLLPECVYPAYFLLNLNGVKLRPTADVLELFAGKAKTYGCYIALGLMEQTPDGALYNSGFTLGPNGKIVNHVRKQCLWHFDSCWFSEGTEGELIDLPWGRVGMFVCADGRVPEIPRGMALKGARMFLDPTNWVTSGRNPTDLTNAQAEYMFTARAVENGVWALAANKVGLEQQLVLYCGKSCIVSPEGVMLARASSNTPEIIWADITLNDSDGLVDGVFGPLKIRRPKTYTILTQETPELRIAASMEEPIVPSRGYHRVAALQVNMETRPDDIASRIDKLLRHMDAEGVELVVLPEPLLATVTAGSLHEDDVNGMVGTIVRLSEKTGCVVVFTWPERHDGCTFLTSHVIHRGRVLGKYRKTHLDAGEIGTYSQGDLGYPVIQTASGRVGVMLGYEGLIPEVARVPCLKGAEVIAWPCSFTVNRQDIFARTRSAENKVFVVAANAIGGGRIGESIISNPSGGVIGAGFRGVEQGVEAQVLVSEARCKALVPGTDVVLNRRPGRYQVLLKDEE